jgi:hypothetical protein
MYAVGIHPASMIVARQNALIWSLCSVLCSTMAVLLTQAPCSKRQTFAKDPLFYLNLLPKSLRYSTDLLLFFFAVTGV